MFAGDQACCFYTQVSSRGLNLLNATLLVPAIEMLNHADQPNANFPGGSEVQRDRCCCGLPLLAPRCVRHAGLAPQQSSTHPAGSSVVRSPPARVPARPPARPARLLHSIGHTKCTAALRSKQAPPAAVPAEVEGDFVVLLLPLKFIVRLTAQERMIQT